MASEVAAAKILCEANRRRKLGELGQNFHLADTPQPLLPSPMTPRPQSNNSCILLINENTVKPELPTTSK
jgi:hypothetical protein